MNEKRNQLKLDNGATAFVNGSKCTVVENAAGSAGLKTVAPVAGGDGGGVSLVHGGVEQVLTMIRSVISEGRMTAKHGAIEELGRRITEAMPSTRARKVVGKPAKRVKVAEEVVVSNEPAEEDAGGEELLAS